MNVKDVYVEEVGGSIKTPVVENMHVAVAGNKETQSNRCAFRS